MMCIRYGAGAILAAVTLIAMVPVYAQQSPPDSAAPRSGNARAQSVQQITETLRQKSGLTVLATSDLVRQSIVPHDSLEGVTTDSLETYLDGLVRRVPMASWAKVYLPSPAASGRRYTGDAVAQLVMAQAGVFGRPTKAPPGTVDIMGKRMTTAEAEPYIKGLGLEPCYVLYSRQTLTGQRMGSPNMPASPGGSGGDQITNALLKQLGVSNMKDIPSGEYTVPFTGPDGATRNAHVSVTNADGRMRIAVSVGQD
jgi:hypothetical protein